MGRQKATKKVAGYERLSDTGVDGSEISPVLSPGKLPVHF